LVVEHNGAIKANTVPKPDKNIIEKKFDDVVRCSIVTYMHSMTLHYRLARREKW